MAETPSERIRPLAALRAIRALLRDPDDTARVFEIIEALSGSSGRRLFERFVKTEDGARMLAERPDLLATLQDRDALLALPEGSLGRVYADFVAREQISADGLVAASEEPDRRGQVSEERIWFGSRLRDMHDLWHVVTGYGRDLVGEAALLAFTYAQTRNHGIGFIVAVAYLRAGDAPEARRLMREAYARGRRAAWLPGEDWEALLAQPLDAVRERLAVGEPPRYEELRSAEAPPMAPAEPV